MCRYLLLRLVLDIHVSQIVCNNKEKKQKSLTTYGHIRSLSFTSVTFLLFSSYILLFFMQSKTQLSLLLHYYVILRGGSKNQVYFQLKKIMRKKLYWWPLNCIPHIQYLISYGRCRAQWRIHSLYVSCSIFRWNPRLCIILL